MISQWLPFIIYFFIYYYTHLDRLQLHIRRDVHARRQIDGASQSADAEFGAASERDLREIYLLVKAN